jgi:hypothetical protein
MSRLAALILQHEAATSQAVDDALSRQILHGGDLATNLLELGAVEEVPLHELLAESNALVPAPSGELPMASPTARIHIDADTARRHQILPLEMRAGRLVIAVGEPLPATTLSLLQKGSGVTLSQTSALSVRIREGLARDYGGPLDVRTLRLVARLSGRPDPMPSIRPSAGAEQLRFGPGSIAPLPILPVDLLQDRRARRRVLNTRRTVWQSRRTR